MSGIKTAQQMVDEANAVIKCIDVEDAQKMIDDESVLFVDIRDIRELWREGTIPGSMSAPRGMLEFWIDPDCKYHKDAFSDGRELVLFCASAWRSALATKVVQDMGFKHVAHLTGGFSAWKAAGYDIEKVEQRQKKR